MRHYEHIEKSAFHNGEYVGYLNGSNAIRRYDKRGIWRMYYSLPDGNTHMIKGKLYEIEAHCAQYNGTQTHEYRKTRHNMEITEYTATSKKPFNDETVTATYNLHIPPAHVANGTQNEIVQACTCSLFFSPATYGDVPYLVMRNDKLTAIYKPERFGAYGTTEERLQYLYNFVHDSTIKTEA